MVRLQVCPLALHANSPPWFQSHYGAIASLFLRANTPTIPQVSIPLWCDCKPLFNVHNQPTKGAFQSHYGAIASETSEVEQEPIEQAFNPTMVRLQVQLCHINTHKKSAFNPTMVRLQGRLPALWWSIDGDFQSHYGAIASSLCRHRCNHLRSFQSHYGAIASAVLASTEAWTAAAFNPTMVRLQVWIFAG